MTIMNSIPGCYDPCLKFLRLSKLYLFHCPLQTFPPRIRARERLHRDDPAQRPPDWSPDRHPTDASQPHHRTQGNAPQFSAHLHPDPPHHRTLHQPQPSPGHGHHAYAPAAEPCLAMPAQLTKHQAPGPPEVPRRRPSADQVYAAQREARMEARQALKEEAHTEGLLKSRKAVLPSEIRKREKSTDDTTAHRGRSEEMEWQSYSPERRRPGCDEEDLEKAREARVRERGRERQVERRERGRTFPAANVDNQAENQFRSTQQLARPHQNVDHNQDAANVLERVEARRRQQNVQVMEQENLRLKQETQPRQERLNPIEIVQEPLRKEPKLLTEQLAHQNRQKVEQPELRQDSEMYLQKARSRGVDLKPKVRMRSMSDIGISQSSTMYRLERAGREIARSMPASGLANGDVGTLDTRVSVAQLRHSYLENANRKPEL